MLAKNLNRSSGSVIWAPILALAGVFLATLVLFLIFWALAPFQGDVASAVRSKSAFLQVSSQLKDFRGKDLGAYGGQSRYIVPLDSIPPRVQKAFIAAEDDGFWGHSGISLRGLSRAFVANIKRDKFAQGGSTITQQLVRQLLLPRQKTINRKFREIILAVVLELQMSKQEILSLWLNSVYLGNNSWGVEAAARNYFGKDASRLNIAEAAVLAGLPQAPTLYAPHLRPNLARKRQLYVLNRMKKLGWLRDGAYNTAKRQKWNIALNKRSVEDQTPWVTETARVELWRRLEQKNIPGSGLIINTTINKDWQLDLQRLVSTYLGDLNKRGLEAAILVVDSKSGDIRALVGGSDFKKSQFNRSIDLNRPLGASIYPLLFVWGIEKGLLTVDGYSSIAEAAVKSRFAEAEQIAPELGYGVVREKLANLGLRVGDVSAIDELQGSPLSLARAFLGISGSPHEGGVAGGVISNVTSSGGDLYRAEATSGNRTTPDNVAWVIRQWMALGSNSDSRPLSGQPLLKSIKGWNAWWIVPRTDVIISAWVGAELEEPQNPDALKLADHQMDQLLSHWIGQNLAPNGIGVVPEGISYHISPANSGLLHMRIPFVVSGANAF